MLEPNLPAQLADAQWSDPCSRCAPARDLVVVNTVPFDVLAVESFSSAITRFRQCGNSHVINFLAAHPTVVARQVPAYSDMLNASDLVVSDGTPIAFAMRTLARRARRVTATDGFLRVCRDGLDSGLRHYFVGGANEAVAKALRQRLDESFPGIQIVGFETPPFRPYTSEELASLAASIKRSEADVVWVGLGAPKQEVLSHRLRVLDPAPAIVTIGATFDFVAGTKSRAPRLLRYAGLEWLYRVAQEPRRLWRRYLVGNTQFLAGIAIERPRRIAPRDDLSGSHTT